MRDRWRNGFALIVSLFGSMACADANPERTLVGFRVLATPDSARLYQGEGAPMPRPLHAMLWYPAARGAGPALAYRDYLVEFDGSDPLLRYRERYAVDQVPDSAYERLWEMPVPAVRDAPPRQAGMPLVLLAVGANAPAYFYSEMAETLAGDGYVVAVVPSFPDSVNGAFGLDSSGFVRQRQDLEHALRRLGNLEFVDTSVVVAGGWSVGGLSAALFALRHPQSVKAVLSLDGALGYEYALAPARRLGLEPRCLALPILFFTGTRPGQFRVPKTRAIFENLPGPDAYWGVIPGLSHADFTSFMGSRAPDLNTRPHHEETTRGTEQLYSILSAFLERYVRGNHDAWYRVLTEEAIESLRADPDFACPAGTTGDPVP